MLSDAQHTELKRLLKKAIDGTDRYEKNHALQDAARIVGIVSDRHFIGADFIKAGTKSGHVGDEALTQTVYDASEIDRGFRDTGIRR